MTFAPVVLSLVLLAGCGGGDGIVLPREGEPAAIAVLRGDGQRGRVLQPLNDPLVVQVTDARGRPVEGATVAFDFSSAGAGASVVPQERTTDGDGQANAQLVLGTSIGRQTGQARLVLAEGRGPIQASFSAMALPENANTMAAVAGQDQTGHVGLPLDDRLVVEVTDGFGNPVPGVPISWAAVGGGSVSEAVVDTDEDGRSRVDRTLGPTVGQQSTVASSEGLAGSPVTFVHTALAGDASRLVILSGNDQTAEAGSVLPGDLVVQLIDGDGNGVPQTAVSWVVATGGGTATPVNSTTDGEGRTSARWTLGATLGQQRLDAVVSGVGVASFRATATSGAPASLFIRTQPSASARNGVPFGRQPVIQLRDSRGNDVSQAGVEVSAAIGSGGGELSGTRQVSTDASGRATFTNLSISGAPGSRTLVFTASGYARVTSSEIALEAIETNTTITGDSPDPSGVGTAFTVSFQVTSQGPTPTGSVSVSDGVQSCTGSLSSGAGSCQLTLSTEGQRTLTATYAGGPGFAGSSDTDPHRVDAPAPENEEPEADFNWHCEDLTCHFTDASRDRDGTITNRHWDFGDGATTDNELNPSHTYATPGDYRVILTVTDNGGLTDDASDTVDPEAPPPPNQAPVAEFSSQCDELDCEFRDQSTDSDGRIEDHAWTFGDGGTSDDRDPDHRYSSDGTYQVTLTVADNDGGTNSVTHAVTVAATPAPPANTTTTITTDAPDPSNPGQAVTVSFTVSSGAGTPSGTVTVSDGVNSCTDGFTGSGSCQVALTTSGPRTLTATYGGSSSFNGSAGTEPHTVNPPPPANTTTTITADSPDPSDPGQSITVSFTVSSGAGTPSGTVTVTGENVTGSCTTPLSGGSGSCDITFTAQGDNRITASYGGDNRFEASDDDESHQVNPAPQPNQAPTAVDDAATTDAEASITIDVLANDSDPDGDNLATENVSNPPNGSAVINGDGTITYTPDPGFNGSDSFAYIASDGSLTDDATVTVTVNPPPAPPGP